MDLIHKQTFLVKNINTQILFANLDDCCLHLIIDDAVYLRHGKELNFNEAEKFINDFKSQEFKVRISGTVIGTIIGRTTKIVKVMVIIIEFEPPFEAKKHSTLSEHTMTVNVVPLDADEK